MTDLQEFRAATRAWLEENCPQEMRQPMNEADVCWGGRNWVFQSDAQRDWLNAMADRGWTVPEWPKAYGGGGLNGDEQRVLKEELDRINARPPLQSFGIWMLGPALLEFGTEEQKRHYLPQVARGEIRWCQGYSEPGAGSDLAGVQTKGVDAGDYFEVSGQKIWTSYADKADWIFCLVRTEPDAPKHKGISFLLFDMASEGVTTKPIKLISGASPFCETFFDGVKVPKDQIVSERGKGWTVAKYLLTHEREMIGSSDAALFGSEDLVEVARDAIGLNENNQLDDPVLRGKIADFLIDELAFDAELARAKDWMRAGNQLGVESATLKYTGTELNKRRQELIMEAGGLEALEWDFANAESDEKASLWLRSKGNSIEGGTSEVMLSILSKAVLELG
ncbi:acyl-CoA dehydrogenase family protein [Shimia thalassica]|jgi:acyl-CoA dehydrogenase|uniref:acyl-CoA dehydrogenase family protein n=1 Tax=Shimia thalassica TaxID=1715693 RepID=UPI000C08A0C8|nr:acyl-CoA dehydrogenase family protein [Shimia thalassica]MDO6798893.1 acyl-CoA dehydrogenase family protein [Shimia thalassica]MDP2494542.1 acyl-CoA dehydrogenase family protein [Shimia thalassica]MDP2579695.1 acyl-CoA dehydrogenase family protein [Shimia thalassica]PHO06007.1 acyl-CoA dehydrogenase [Rhodobacteraceae bacterium 4F10]